MSKKRRRPLSEDDLNIWRQVARTARPLHPGRVRPSGAEVALPAADVDQGTSRTGPPVAEFRIGQKATYDHSLGHNLTPTLQQRMAAAPVRMDARAYRTMRKGKLRPERRIDLHGMSLARAHPALSRFVIEAQRDGCRLVLVVTGKGKSGTDDGGPIPVPRGVLRNQVPVWLNLPPLRSLVLQVAEAHLCHGGSGAYYVYLARRK
ncbi:Smr/MutS family protein [Tropicimonas sp.]|uniref:Smr/MutS family protein n=1 Tax=Tropicimonas sp. TaxID=2067044 RepID=UPI003A843701